MSRRRGPTPKKGSRRAAPLGPDGYWQAQTADTVVQDLYVNTLGCRHGACEAPAVRWYLRLEPEDRRLVVYPTCLVHDEQAEAFSCGPGCADPEGRHFVADHDDLAGELEAALLGLHYGIGFPSRVHPGQLDVIRPRLVEGHPGIA